ncbi:hypothetical protein AC578_5683, partial [Pseudocercospora eumusae]
TTRLPESGTESGQELPRNVPAHNQHFRHCQPCTILAITSRCALRVCMHLPFIAADPFPTPQRTTPDSELLPNLDYSEEDNDSLSSYTVYSSAASDDDSPTADEKRRIRQELDNAAFADMARAQPEQERMKQGNVEERQQRRRELFGVLGQWLHVVAATALPSGSLLDRHAPIAQEDRVEMLEEYYYGAETHETYQRKHPEHAKALQRPSASSVTIGPRGGWAEPGPEALKGPSTRMSQDEFMGVCELCFSVPICSIHGKGKQRPMEPIEISSKTFAHSTPTSGTQRKQTRAFRCTSSAGRSPCPLRYDSRSLTPVPTRPTTEAGVVAKYSSIPTAVAVLLVGTTVVAQLVPLRTTSAPDLRLDYHSHPPIQKGTSSQSDVRSSLHRRRFPGQLFLRLRHMSKHIEPIIGESLK